MKALALLTVLAALGRAATVTTLIGTGMPGYSQTQVNNPYGMAIGPDGALYWCDLGSNRVRRMDLATTARYRCRRQRSRRLQGRRRPRDRSLPQRAA